MRYLSFALLLCIVFAAPPAFGQTSPPTHYLLKPDHVFDGEQMHEGWVVLVLGDQIEAAGAASAVKAPSDVTVLELKGATLLPGLIEGHSQR